MVQRDNGQGGVVRGSRDGAQRERHVWLVETRLQGAHEDPWWLPSDRPLTSAEEATGIFRGYRQRGSVEDECCGGEGVQVPTLDAVRRLVALGWVAADFLDGLCFMPVRAAVRLLARLGGGSCGPTGRPASRC